MYLFTFINGLYKNRANGVYLRLHLSLQIFCKCWNSHLFLCDRFVIHTCFMGGETFFLQNLLEISSKSSCIWYDYNWKEPKSWPWRVRMTFLPSIHWSRYERSRLWSNNLSVSASSISLVFSWNNSDNRWSYKLDAKPSKWNKRQ